MKSGDGQESGDTEELRKEYGDTKELNKGAKNMTREELQYWTY